FTRRGALDVANPILLDKVAISYPNMRIIVAHVGQPWYAETIVLMWKHPKVYADISARTARRSQLYNILRMAIDYRVTHQFLWGSDFPVFAPGASMAHLKALSDFGPAGFEVPADVVREILSRQLSDLGLH